MTALLDVACYLPEGSVDIDEIGAAIGADAKLMWTFKRFHGLSRVRRAPQETIGQTMAAAAAGLAMLPGNEHRVRYVIAARTTATVTRAGRPPVEDVRRQLGLANAVSFTLTQHACATGLLAVELAGQLLAADGDPDALALVVTGEKVINPLLEIIPQSTVMGEGTAACLVGADGPHDRVLGYATHTYGRYSEGFPPHPIDASFFKDHNDLLAAVMTEAAEAAGITLDDLSLILPHNVNRLSWSWTCRALQVPLEKVFLDLVPVTGHCFTADPLINYVHARAAGRLRPGDLYLMASVGLGATFSAAVLRH